MRPLLVALIGLMPGLAFAHTGAGETAGFFHGFGHPFGGFDHVLTMVVVGLAAAQLGGRALWLVPLSFLAMMAVGGALGMAGAKVPLIEVGIGLSVIVLGLAIAFQRGIPTFAAVGFVSLVALLHGHAHGAEMPETASGLSYGAGFVCATALLLAVGIGLGMAIGLADRRRRIVQVGGTAIALIGAGILGGLF
jgi:urease accessory protein